MVQFNGPVTVEQGEVISNLGLEVENGEYYAEIKIYKGKPKKQKSLIGAVGQDEFDAFVENFWAYYPKRRGIHFNKKLAEAELNKVASEEMQDVIRGAVNYSQTQQAKEGYSSDAHRWLRRREWESFQEAPARERNRATL